jgi:CheY-like chemotaxis protein
MPEPQPATVLLVEDAADTREMYADYLRHCGFIVTTATNGTEALDAARLQAPDLILMDAAMPGVDGWRATKLLKSDPRTRDVPVLMLTAHVFPEHRAKAEEVGAEGFIAKPCMPDELAREVAAALQRWRNRTGDGGGVTGPTEGSVAAARSDGKTARKKRPE